MKRLFLILCAVVFGGSSLFASNAWDDFSVGNKLYAEGKFADAAGIYRNILNSGAVSPNLLFNDGNAEFKSGNLGRAIAAYRRAALLAPRDSDIRANLNFARNQVQGAAARGNSWSRIVEWLDGLTLDEWAILAAMAFWLALLLFATMQIAPATKTSLRGFARVAAVAAIFICVCLGLATTAHFSSSVAVVVLPDAVTRSGPFDDAQNAFAVHDGAELTVLDQRNGWVQVSDGTRTGWMKATQLEVLPEI